MHGPWDPIPGDRVRVRYGTKARQEDGAEVEVRDWGPRRVLAIESGPRILSAATVTVEGIGQVPASACHVEMPTEGPEAEARALKVTHSGGPGRWQGVLKDAAGRAVWACGHYHPNRDLSSRYRSSAHGCAFSEKTRRILVARHGEERGTRYWQDAEEIGRRALHGLGC